MHPSFKGCVLEQHPKGNITQLYGENPAFYARVGLASHNGIDLVAPWGTILLAVESGVIAEVKHDSGGYGRHVRLMAPEKKDGTINMWIYGHCEAILVKPGQKVKAGDPIATMGNTGFVVSSSYADGFWNGHTPDPDHGGTHLHLGLRRARRAVKGFTYPGSPIRIEILDYGNGNKGSVDPLPILRGSSGATPEQWALFETLKKLVALLIKQKQI